MKNSILKTACAYIRVSTHMQEELSPDTQKELIFDYCRRNGYLISDDDLFTDLGISGKEAEKRPGFTHMIAKCKSKEHPYDAVIVWKFSRFARNQPESVIYKRMLLKENVKVISVSEPISDDIGGRIAESIFEIMDEYYSINLAQEVTRGMKENAKRGNYQCRTPYGYKRIASGEYEVVEAEAAVIRYAFEQYSTGVGLSTITSHINAQGIRSRAGRPFERKTIAYMLENPFYCGMIRWNYKDHKVSSQSIKDEAEWIITEGKHTAIVSKDLWDEVNNLIKSRKRPAAPRTSHKHWLSGLIRCKECGSTLIYHSAKRGNDAFVCNGYNKRICNHSQRYSVKKMEEAFIEGLKLCTTSDSYNLIKSDTVILPDVDVKAELNNLLQKEKRIKEAYRNGIYSIDELKEEKAIIDAERERLSKVQEQIIVPERDIKKEIRTLLDMLQDDSVENVQKNEQLKQVIDKVVFDKTAETLDFYLFE